MEIAAYLSLFLIAFGAATILPLQSEVVVVGMLLSGKFSWQSIVVIASIGNVLGSMVNWLLGRSLMSFQGRFWVPVNQKGLSRAEHWYRRYGRSSLLFSWAPIVGDPFTIVAGILREPLWSFIVLVGVAKVGRYLVLTAITLHWSS